MSMGSDGPGGQIDVNINVNDHDLLVSTQELNAAVQGTGCEVADVDCATHIRRAGQAESSFTAYGYVNDMDGYSGDRLPEEVEAVGVAVESIHDQTDCGIHTIEVDSSDRPPEFHLEGYIRPNQ